MSQPGRLLHESQDSTGLRQCSALRAPKSAKRSIAEKQDPPIRDGTEPHGDLRDPHTGLRNRKYQPAHTPDNLERLFAPVD